ncbi:Spo71 protein [Maudiozyma humilis]|uniref:Spo71 protein n=1 Tax=Maudiozyma humilis TaxID=51915 RepID=A0AAV5RXV4_MAUHU|nr:Spo71 protein [Kazachstania humilis]
MGDATFPQSHVKNSTFEQDISDRPEESEVKFEIPDYSFLAVNLKIGAPEDIFDNLETLFIGYIPDSWRNETKYTFAGKLEHIFNKEAQEWKSYLQEVELQQIYGIKSSGISDDQAIINLIIRKSFPQISEYTLLNNRHLVYPEVENLSVHSFFSRTLKSNIRNNNSNGQEEQCSKNNCVCPINTVCKISKKTLFSEKKLGEISKKETPPLTEQRSCAKHTSLKDMITTQDGNFNHMEAVLESNSKLTTKLDVLTPKPLDNFDTVLLNLDDIYPIQSNTLSASWSEKRTHHSFSTVLKGKDDIKFNDVLFSRKLLLCIEFSEFKTKPSKTINIPPNYTRTERAKWKECMVTVGRASTKPEMTLCFYPGYSNWKSLKYFGNKFYREFDYHSFVMDSTCKIIAVNGGGQSLTVQRVIPIRGPNMNRYLSMSYYFVVKSKYILLELLNAISTYQQGSLMMSNSFVCFPGVPLSLSINYYRKSMVRQCSIGQHETPCMLTLVQHENGYRILTSVLKDKSYKVISGELRRCNTELNLSINGYRIYHRYGNYYELDTEHVLDKMMEKPNVTLPHQLCLLPYAPSKGSVFQYCNNTLLHSKQKPANIEGLIWEIIKSGFSKISKDESMITRPVYIFNVGNIIFLLPEARSIKPIIELKDIILEDSRYPSGMSIEKFQLGNPFELDKESHIEWLKPEISASEFLKRDYQAYKCYTRKLSMVLSSNHCIDLLSLQEIYRGDSQHKCYPSKFIKYLKRAFRKISKVPVSASELLGCLIVLKKSNNEYIEFLLPSPDIANVWVQHISSLKDYYKNKSYHDLQLDWNKIVHSRCNRDHISSLVRNDITLKDSLNPRVNELEKSMILLPTPSISEIVLFRGVLFCKGKRRGNFKKYFVVLVPNFLIFYKWDNLNRIGSPQRALKLCYHRVIPLRASYIENFSTSMELSPHCSEICYGIPCKAFSDGWKSDDKRSSRVFTVHHLAWYGLNIENHSKNRRTLPQTHEFERYKCSEQQDILSARHKYKSTVLWARTKHEMTVWVSLISGEIRRSQNYI